MKKSSLMHGSSILTGTLGALALMGAWLAGENGATLGFSRSHLFNDAIILQLIAISAGICASYRREIERESAGSNTK